MHLCMLHVRGMRIGRTPEKRRLVIIRRIKHIAHANELVVQKKEAEGMRGEELHMPTTKAANTRARSYANNVRFIVRTGLSPLLKHSSR